MEKLTTGECRLLLLSDCIKYFRDVKEYTTGIRNAGKERVLGIGKKEQIEINYFLNEEDVRKIRGMLRNEWNFTGKVVDIGRGNKVTCEYCQHQQIRYKYLCVNGITEVWLAVGSVCVGYIVHGEKRMKDKDFANKFVGDLERLKGSANFHNGTEEANKVARANQFKTINLCYTYLSQNGITETNNDFLFGLKQRWNSGKPLSDKQLVGLKNLAHSIKLAELSKRGVK